MKLEIFFLFCFTLYCFSYEIRNVSISDGPVQSLMSLQKCTDITEAVPLEVGLGLFLKPASKIKISVQLPKLKTPGQSISTFQVMTKLRATIRPDVFLSLKALKITSAVIKFLGELETKAASERALARMQATGGIKLTAFSEWLQIRAAHSACAGPTRHDWDSFFRDARGVDEMKPGERPDTIHLQELPASWFSESTKSIKPSERLLHKAFSVFGRIRRLEIPSNLKLPNEQIFQKTSSLYKDLIFQVYIQYEEYVEFATAMNALRGKKLLHKDALDGRVYSAEIKVDFDRTNYLSDRNIKKRALEAEGTSSSLSRSSENEIDSEKDSNLLLVKQEADVNEIDLSERDLKQEAGLLLKELLLRSEASEKEKENEMKTEKAKIAAQLALAAEREREEITRVKKKKHKKLLHQERILKGKLLQNLKAKEQQKIAEIREKLRKELVGQKLLSVLASSNHQTINSTKKPS